MHYLMFVTLSLHDHTTSEDARLSVYNHLSLDESFCGNGGRFGSPIADWFLIGGRWSGILALSILGQPFQTALTARFPELANQVRPEDLADQNRSEFDAIWVKCGGHGPSPYGRLDCDDFGFPDDAMPLTEPLYASHLVSYAGQRLVSDSCHCEYLDLDDEPLTPDFVGRKWLVIVDYHN